MNIRDQVIIDVYKGVVEHAVVNTVPGIRTGDGTFIPFHDLGWDGSYFRLSAESLRMSRTTNENPETIHRGEWSDAWDAYVWMDGDGYPHLLGERHQVADLYWALHNFLLYDEMAPEPISENDPAWGRSFTVAEAVEEAIRYGFGGMRLDSRIRAAAKAGRIPGAVQGHGGRWLLPKTHFRLWLLNDTAHRPGPKAKQPENPE